MKKMVLLLSLLFMPCIGHAATGDVLFNCTFEGTGTTASQVVTACGAQQWTIDNSASIVAGAGHDGGRAISYYYPNAGNEVIDLFQINNINKNEVTIEYWEKFDVNPSNSNVWNVKSTRAYTNVNGGADFMGGMMSLWGGQMWQQGNFGSATMTTTSYANNVVIDPAGYCTGSGTSYNCPNGRTSMNWSSGFGTSWHKVRIYYKVPASVSAADGITKVWIDDNLIYTLNNIKGTSTWSPYISYITFHPSDDFFATSGTKFPFHHLYDDIKLYDGYVPPSTGGGTLTLSAPIGLKVVAL